MSERETENPSMKTTADILSGTAAIYMGGRLSPLRFSRSLLISVNKHL